MPCMESTMSMVMRSSPRTRPEARGPVEGQHQDGHVDPQAVEVPGPEPPQVHRGVAAHAEAVGAHQPGPVVSARGSRATQAWAVLLASWLNHRSRPARPGAAPSRW